MTEDLERRLAQGLHHRVDALGASPLTFDEVRRTARGIRRRRRAAGVGGFAALVLAFAVPVTLGAAGGDGAPDRPPVLERPEEAAPVRLPALTTLPRGDVPRVAYVDPATSTYVAPGRTAALAEPYLQVVPEGDGYLALSPSGPAVAASTVRLVRLDADLRVVEDLGPAGDVLVADGDRVAWVERRAGGSPTVVVSVDGVAAPVGEVAGDQVLVRGFLPDGELVVEAFAADGSRLAAVTPTPERGLALGGFASVTDTSAATGVVVGASLPTADRDACARAVRVGTDRALWTRCDLSVGPLSPAGAAAVAHRGEGQPGHDGLVVLDATTGATVLEVEVERPGVQVGQVVWEDEDSLLALVSDGGRQAVVRVGLDGSLERATDAAAVDPMSAGLWFATEPRL